MFVQKSVSLHKRTDPSCFSCKKIQSQCHFKKETEISTVEWLFIFCELQRITGMRIPNNSPYYSPWIHSLALHFSLRDYSKQLSTYLLFIILCSGSTWLSWSIMSITLPCCLKNTTPPLVAIGISMIWWLSISCTSNVPSCFINHMDCNFSFSTRESF